MCSRWMPMRTALAEMMRPIAFGIWSRRSRGQFPKGNCAVCESPLALGTGLFARSFGGGFDQVRNGGWLRDVDRMAARHLDDGGAGALGHETLGGRRNHFVVGDDQIPTRLGPPCRRT